MNTNTHRERNEQQEGTMDVKKEQGVRLTWYCWRTEGVYEGWTSVKKAWSSASSSRLQFLRLQRLHARAEATTMIPPMLFLKLFFLSSSSSSSSLFLLLLAIAFPCSISDRSFCFVTDYLFLLLCPPTNFILNAKLPLAAPFNVFCFTPKQINNNSFHRV